MSSAFDTLVRTVLRPKVEPIFNSVKPKGTIEEEELPSSESQMVNLNVRPTKLGKVPKDVEAYVRTQYPRHTTISELRWHITRGTYFVIYRPAAKTGMTYPQKILILARVQVEMKLGRPLKPNERIDQSVPGHPTLAVPAGRAKKELEFNPQNCPVCSREFTPSVWQYRNQRQSKYAQAGPFCSKYCASTYNGQRRNGGAKLPTVPITIKENSH